MIKTLFKNRYLLGQMIKKDIGQRYKGSVLGMLWTFIVPILMLMVYTFVFSEIFQAKWNINTNDKYEFALVLFCGLSAFNMISEVMNRAATLIASNTNYVKKVIFPLEILPLVVTFSALFNCFISYLILILAKIILYHNISKTIYQSMFIFAPLILLTAGICYLLSALSVYLKDISNIISVIVMVLMYMSPVFFSLSSVPAKFQSICMINPMTFIIENFRNTILYGYNINVDYYLASLIIALIFFSGGSIIFSRAKEGFPDVL